MAQVQAPEKVEAAKFEKDAQLHLFGINSDSQPTPTRFPKVFNAANTKLWSEILASEAYKNFCKTHTKASEMWQFCIKAYLKTCSLQKVFPFAGRPDFEQLTKSFLSSARGVLVKWFKESEIFNYVKLKKVTRECSFTHQNFSLEVKAELRPIDDPTFEKWLTKQPHPGFKKQEGVYCRSLKAHIDVFFTIDRGVPYLTYRIFCHTPVRVLEPGRLGKAKLTEYVTDKLWHPIIKQHPIEGIGNRRY